MTSTLLRRFFVRAPDGNLINITNHRDQDTISLVSRRERPFAAKAREATCKASISARRAGPRAMRLRPLLTITEQLTIG